LSGLADTASFSVQGIPLAGSEEWHLQAGHLVHRSGGFFKVIGLRWDSPDGSIQEQPFLDQREIGTLGFLLKRDDGVNSVLLQAKAEPGNVGLHQVAPTCQATYSNANRKHGGDYPPFVDYFTPDGGGVIYDLRQSEQGTRFYEKLNRNVLAQANGDFTPPPSHRWYPVDDVLELLNTDYLVNTDARSVLVCSPWEVLLGRRPFSKYPDGFGAELMDSYRTASMHKGYGDLVDELRSMRDLTKSPDVVELGDLDGWRIAEDGVEPVSDAGGPYRVRQIKVHAQGREVPRWDQPIIDSVSEGKVVLVCGRINGVLHFLFRASREPGLVNKVELTPTVVVEPGASEESIPPDFMNGVVRAKCLQSEEGGRFYKDSNLYCIIDAGDACKAPHGHYWLTLLDIRRLLDGEGWLTNEARSALSLLLPFM